MLDFREKPRKSLKNACEEIQLEISQLVKMKQQLRGVQKKGSEKAQFQQIYWVNQMQPVDFPELSERPEITEMTENLKKVSKYLTKFKENVWEKSQSKSSKNKIFRGLPVFEYVLWQNTKTRKCRKPTESFLNQKSTQC